ncbi:MAG TPA: sugar transferase [Gemmatimonadales bacterium]|nr:sugar transferase [Gemmatimonadales bacterium]
MTTFPILLEQSGSPRRRTRRSVVAFSSVEVARRLLNVTIAFVALAVALPLILLIAVAVKLSSRGPVFYTQTRIGMNRRRLLPPGSRYRQEDCGGKPFTIFKFRTMRVNGDSGTDGEQTWATPDDPRITRVGRLLRLYRLDELPQLVNVLLGDMDIVGPRPEQPAIFARLREEIPGYQERQCVRPGITGWAQINLHYDTSVEDVRKKLALDLEYISRRSLTEDLRIMFRTVPVVAGKFGGW